LANWEGSWEGQLSGVCPQVSSVVVLSICVCVCGPGAHERLPNTEWISWQYYTACWRFLYDETLDSFHAKDSAANIIFCLTVGVPYKILQTINVISSLTVVKSKCFGRLAKYLDLRF